jgi:hypothetical protein
VVLKYFLIIIWIFGYLPIDLPKLPFFLSIITLLLCHCQQKRLLGIEKFNRNKCRSTWNYHKFACSYRRKAHLECGKHRLDCLYKCGILQRLSSFLRPNYGMTIHCHLLFSKCLHNFVLKHVLLIGGLHLTFPQK